MYANCLIYRYIYRLSIRLIHCNTTLLRPQQKLRMKERDIYYLWYYKKLTVNFTLGP